MRPLLVERGAITRLTPKRPERQIEIITELGNDLADELSAVGRSSEIKVVGAGNSFCSGNDRTGRAGGRIPDYPRENPNLSSPASSSAAEVTES